MSDVVPHRYLPHEPLPPYSYVSGKFPHPIRDPSGHSYGHAPPPIATIDPTRPGDCPLYLRGIDLFNHGYYWEAHETWEALWHNAGRRGILADFFKALIKLAAAGVKAREARATGVRLHALRAAELLTHVRNGGPYEIFMGVDLARLIEQAERLAARAPEILDTSDAPVRRVMPFEIRPAL